VTGDDLTAIRVDEFLPHPPAKVWRALTDADLMAKWLMPGDFRLEVGHRFTLRCDPIPAVRFGGVVFCEVLAFEPERMLRIAWVDRGTDNGLDSTVTWRLVPEGRGTRLFVEHEGFDPDHPFQQLGRQIMGGQGWRATMRGLGEVLARVDR
jgi:uncharacterized protein YndB with AHSA1/START domain